MSVDAHISGDVDLFGLSVDDLQSELDVGDDAIVGTLNYVSDYSTAFPAGEDSGNYMVLHAEADVEGAVITAELVNGVHGPTTLDADGLCIFRVTDKDSQKVKIVASKDGYTSDVKEFDLTGLTLNEE